MKTNRNKSIKGKPLKALLEARIKEAKKEKNLHNLLFDVLQRPHNRKTSNSDPLSIEVLPLLIAEVVASREVKQLELNQGRRGHVWTQQQQSRQQCVTSRENKSASNKRKENKSHNSDQKSSLESMMKSKGCQKDGQTSKQIAHHQSIVTKSQ